MKLKLFKYISYKYYKQHFSHVICIILPILICISSLLCIMQFKTSYETYQYNKVLSDYGDYDFLLYDMSDDDYLKLLDSDIVQEVGKLSRIGIVSSNDIFVSCGVADRSAADMLSINLIDGNYPEQENEVLVSKGFLTKTGVKPIVGNTIHINTSGNPDETAEEDYKIAGIFDTYRYVNGNKEIKWTYQDNEDSAEFSYPDIYFSENTADLNSDIGFFKNAVVFKVNITEEKDDADIYEEIDAETGELGFLKKYFNDKARLCHNSRIINDLVLEWSSDDTESANTKGYHNVTARLTNGTIKKDFLTIVILPLLSAAIIIIGISSVISAMKTSIYDRKERYKTLSVLGMSAEQMILCMSLETLIWAVLGIVLGLIFGNCIYRIALSVLQDFPSALDANGFVKAITLSPYPFIFIFVILYLVLAVFFIVNSMKKDKKPKDSARKSKLHGSISAIHYMQKADGFMRMNNIFSKIIITTLSFTVITSFIYATECQKTDAVYQNYEYPYGNYYAERDYLQCRIADYFENHHDSGIPGTYLEQIKQFSCVNGFYASMINASTKLVYDENNPIAEELNTHVTELVQAGRLAPDDVFYDTDLEILSKLGFQQNEQMFCTPTIGVSDSYLEELSQYVVSGEINLQKIKSGEEVILLQSPLETDDPLYEEYKKLGLTPPPSSAFDLSEVFHIGDVLPLSDVVYNDAAESDNQINSSNTAYYELGGKGTRVDFSPVIGAIVKIDDEKIRNMTAYMGCDGRQPLFNIICSVDAFSNWNLPDINYSKLYVDVTPEDDFSDFEAFWNQVEEKTQKTNFESSSDILNSIIESDRLNKKIFTTIFLVLFVNGILGIVFAVSYSCKIHQQKFTQLYQLGIKKRYFYLYESENLIATILMSLVVVWGIFAAIQQYMTTLQNKMDEYLHTHMALEGKLLYLSELLPMKATWFRIDLLLKPSVLLTFCLIAIILITIIGQFRKMRVRRK